MIRWRWTYSYHCTTSILFKSSLNKSPLAGPLGLFVWNEIEHGGALKLAHETPTPKGVRHMQRSKNTSRWQKVRRLAWDRDRRSRAPCHICGERIDYSLQPSTAPLSWEPDHIVPYAVAPELELDLNNIAPSHMRCNRQRGTGSQDMAIGQRSRIW